MSGPPKHSRRRKHLRREAAEREKLGLPSAAPAETEPRKRLLIEPNHRHVHDRAMDWLVEFWDHVDGPHVRAVRLRYGLLQKDAVRIVAQAKGRRDEAKLFGGQQ